MQANSKTTYQALKPYCVQQGPHNTQHLQIPCRSILALYNKILQNLPTQLCESSEHQNPHPGIQTTETKTSDSIPEFQKTTASINSTATATETYASSAAPSSRPLTNVRQSPATSFPASQNHTPSLQTRQAEARTFTATMKHHIQAIQKV
jgi:hypothetical protein